MSDWYTTLVSRVLFPAHERLKGHATTRVLRSMEASQWLSRAELEALRLKRLKRLLKRAQAAPYYASVLRTAGVDPDDVDSLAVLERLPFLTKDAIRENLEALKTLSRAGEAGRGLSLFNTGGSTGEPLQFYIGPERVSHDVAAKWRATRWWGVDIGDPEIVVWGSPVELGAQDRVRELRDRLFRTRLLPAFEMSEEKLDGFIDAVIQTRPRMLFGYPSALALIARRARRRGVAVDRLGIVVAFVTAEQLFDDQKQAIGETFGCRVANGYGGRDLGFVAHECASGSMHVTAEDIIVEIVDADGRVQPPGAEGEVVVTHLASSEYPFIRYRSGDVAVLSEDACSCGRGLPVVESVRGRTTDFVVAADGTVMHALALIYAVRDVPGVRNFKVIQENLNHTRVLLVTASDFSDERLETIRGRLAERLGVGVRIDLERVDQIPRSRSGKHRYVESRVAQAP